MESPAHEPLSIAEASWSVRMADSMLRRHPVSGMRWRYEDGFLLWAIEQAGLENYRQAVVEYADRFVAPDGSIKTYCLSDYNLDQINPGRLLYPVYRATGEERYRRAIELLREQLRRQPRTQAGGFWHKLIYPHQMWLDGLYMACPFYARYAVEFDEPAALDDVAHQFITIERQALDPRTGLLSHAWDESRQQRWACADTGRSPHFWARAIGWYVMALVDVLDQLPAAHPQAANIAAMDIASILERTLAALDAVVDPATGLWFQVLDQGRRPGNYLEASSACMFAYAMAHGVRMGHLPASWLGAAQRSYRSILAHFVQVDALGEVNLHWTCGTAGLGGDPYRDGSYEYYVTERIVTNDPKGVAAFILAAAEIERAGAPVGAHP